MHLTQLLHKAVQQQPHQPLTVYGARHRTAGQVAERVARLAGGLREQGVAPGDRVCILAFNSDRYFEAVMATWWIGGVVTLLNCRWSLREVADAVADAGSRCLLVDEDCMPLIADLDGPVIVHLGDGTAPAGTVGYEDLIATAPAVEDVRAHGDTLAALIYTGGTTGAAKAAMHSHRSLSTALLGSMGYARSSEPDGATLVMAPVFHIAALLGMMAQTLVGGTLVFANRFEPDEVLQLLGRHRVTTMTSTPGMLQLLYTHPSFPAADVTSLTTIVYGAAPMPEAVLTRAMAAFPNAQFVQGYGMTETAVIASLLGATHRLGGPRLKSAGRATLHVQIIIADEDGNEVPRGAVGEILTRGDNIMLGYWNRPEETAAALRGGWLHTGDLAYMDDEGYIFIVDRAKDMIITGGENVYSTEVENVLSHHPAVLRCAVIGVPDEQWGERVHAIIVPQPGQTVAVEEIREHVKTRLAGFKAPRTIELVQALATTATGKIDKRALRQHTLEQPTDIGRGDFP
ncbi:MULTISPECIES: class I adenylate-forming enzyme family protein [Rhodococcus]|uniref:Fatty-acid--CoA ligase n=1 Tax=Rhodococcus opacus RKJ300 = JCM 13270 TaxID=1165867 RepID=I0WPA7_RHOOP|nr:MULTISPECIES: long-chain-fatty-acid--CoA ligase [Rhodococcus]EID78223.1 fatty-acid--CoA ligase [Rhodococcus opacus RKJ300 = JCM 13270]QQZ14396.1 long-chain-fatty-acid--CoA ligase [Rhodococcus sp. 21391]